MLYCKKRQERINSGREKLLPYCGEDGVLIDFGAVVQVEQYGGEGRNKKSVAVAYLEQYGNRGRIKMVEDLSRMYKSIGLIENYTIAALSGKQNSMKVDKKIRLLEELFVESTVIGRRTE